MYRYLTLLGLILATASSQAGISGQVVDDLTGEAISGARVRIQTSLAEPEISGFDGRFALPDPTDDNVTVTAVTPFDSAAAINYITGSAPAGPGDAIEIRLTRLPLADQAPYDPGSSVECASCHFDQFSQWQESRHAGAGVNPWVLDLFSGDGTPGGAEGFVFRDTHDADDTGFCATCHNPVADAQDPGNVFMNEVTSDSGLDGVGCLGCHQMAEVNENTNSLHHLGNTLYRFPEDSSTPLWVWGPLDDVSFDIMRASYQPGFSDSRYCASCHQYNNPNTGAPGQTTFDEWLASPFAEPGPGFRSCQDCHMPPAEQDGPISTLFGQPHRPAEQRRSHQFVGSNPQTLAAAIDLELHWQIAGGQLQIQARVINHGAGHAFPTGVSIRNAVLVIEATANGQALTQISGPTIPFYGSAHGGTEAGDVAGQPGRGFARVLQGRINGEGESVYPVLFIDAETVRSDTRIPAGQSDRSDYEFSLEGVFGGQAEVSARLLYRRAWRDLAITKNWDETPSGGPIEIEAERVTAQIDLNDIAGPVQMIPAMRPWAMLALISLLMASAWATGSRDHLRP
ncbi:MAG: multiheme c-type cytochrome [Wenzhouxiangellaceae bacterium]|nr:multiheme c-type cytochrome [Wenzhouxiangellaceae bacterium]